MNFSLAKGVVQPPSEATGSRKVGFNVKLGAPPALVNAGRMLGAEVPRRRPLGALDPEGLVKTVGED
jgi:hypothetical protein